MDPNTAVTCTRGHFNQVVCMGLVLFAASKRKAFQTVLWMSEVLHQLARLQHLLQINRGMNVFVGAKSYRKFCTLKVLLLFVCVFLTCMQQEISSQRSLGRCNAVSVPPVAYNYSHSGLNANLVYLDILSRTNKPAFSFPGFEEGRRTVHVEFGYIRRQNQIRTGITQGIKCHAVLWLALLPMYTYLHYMACILHYEHLLTFLNFEGFMMIGLPPCNKVARRTYMLALFPGCSQAQVYPVLVTQHAERNFTHQTLTW